MIRVKEYSISEFEGTGNIGAYNVNYSLPGREDLSGGPATYVISPVTTDSKYSHEYYDCTGFVASGTCLDTGERVSFLSHQDTLKIKKDVVLGFNDAISERVGELLERVDKNNVQIGFFGGYAGAPEAKRLYGSFLQDMSHFIFFLLGQKLQVLVGPNMLNQNFIPSGFSYNTSTNTLEVLRAQQCSETSGKSSFPASEFFDIY